MKKTANRYMAITTVVIIAAIATAIRWHPVTSNACAEPPAVPATGPTTGAAMMPRKEMTGNEAEAAVHIVLRDLGRVPEGEYAGGSYSLVRYSKGIFEYAPDGRPRYKARVTIDCRTGEMTDLRGDYQNNEIELIERYRPEGIIKPEEAIAIACRHINSDVSKAPPGIRTDIDLVGKRYYIIRWPNQVKRVNPGDLTASYSGKMVIDGQTGKVLSIELGIG